MAIQEKKEIYDISVTIGEQSFVMPGDIDFQREMTWTLEESGICNLSKFHMSAHTGAHIDVPAHFMDQGMTIDQYHVRNFIRPAHVIDIADKTSVRPEELSRFLIKCGDAVLFKTDNSRTGKCIAGHPVMDYVYISPEAAQWCVDHRAGIVGIDYQTVDRFGDLACLAHRILLGNQIFILEGIILKDVPPGRYNLLCLPLKIRAAEASPVRAILIG